MCQTVSFLCQTKDLVRYYYKCTQKLMQGTCHPFQNLNYDKRN